MKPDKPTRSSNPMVMLARYSEIGFMIPAALLVGYFLGALVDHFAHTHGFYLAGIVLGIVAGFINMIRRALKAFAEPDDKSDEEATSQPSEKDSDKDKDHDERR